MGTLLRAKEGRAAERIGAALLTAGREPGAEARRPAGAGEQRALAREPATKAGALPRHVALTRPPRARSFIHSGSRAPTHSLTGPLVLSHTHSFICSLIHSRAHSFIHPLAHSFTHSLIHSLLAHSFICSRVHSPIYSFVSSLIHHLAPSSTAHALIYPHTHSFAHSFIPPPCHPLTGKPLGYWALGCMKTPSPSHRWARK